MASRAADTKSLSEPMPEYCWLDPWEQTSVKSLSKFVCFIQENTFETVVSKLAAI